VGTSASHLVGEIEIRMRRLRGSSTPVLAVLAVEAGPEPAINSQMFNELITWANMLESSGG